ncbi:peptide/nickel transport system ATP-binding protein [Polaromonas sp. YR568]|uniref:ABC transporter ATP-binding protein n=1 Tax=Polaromonas sp. YR568 TaxID=1855301 RepID=UPI0008F2F35A|nr:ABC transporter ATP-binding protein [Polaromonas sp. YR568]SFU73820.1 peptide/nickel transport system ATP-binding protein [Polaromonas sp. YR568]
MSSPYLSVKNLSREFKAQGRTVRAVDNVSFEIPAGTTFSLVGESGCGKTTLARVMAGLDKPSAGSLDFAAPAGGRVQRTQMIFQDPYASLNPRWRVGDAIAEPITFQNLRPRAEVKQRVEDLLVRVGLAAADTAKFPHEFSGGQRQRVSIARALAGEPSFLVCDEPTSALDVSVQAQILNLLKRLEKEEGLTSLFISHNLAVVRFVSSMIGVMYLGRLVEVAPTAELFAAPRHPYTQLLLEAIPRIGQGRRAVAVPAGELPSPLAPPPGCTFHPRCPAAMDVCRREAPALRPVANGASVACHAVEAAGQAVRFMPQAAARGAALSSHLASGVPA